MKRKRMGKKAPAPAVPAIPASWSVHAAVLVGLVLANLALYGPTLSLGFFSLDDPDYVINNPYLNGVTGRNVVQICTAPYFANFSPMHLLSYLLDVAVAHGKNAWAMHLSSVLWHALVIVMVYALAFRIRRNLPMAACAALLFLAHPAHVEVAAWISSRKDLVATAFAVLSMILYLEYRSGGTYARAWYGACLASFFLATAGKQSVVLLPAVMLLWDFFVEKRRGWSMLADKIPFGLITVLFALRTIGAQPDTRRTYQVGVLAANQLWNLWLLTGLGDYVIYRPSLEATDWNPAAPVLVLGLVAALWIVPLLLRNRVDPVRLTLWYWILLQLIPPAIFNFITPVTDRYLFLSSVGVCILVADLLFGALQPRAATWKPAAAAVVLALIWAAKTWLYVQEWADPRSVWYAASSKSQAFQNNEYLGTVYQEAGDRMHQFVTAGAPVDLRRERPLAEALLHDAARMIQLETEWRTPPPVKPHSTAYRDELYDLAWEQFELAAARRGTVNTPNLFMRRGMVLMNRGKADDALKEFHFALRLAQTHTYEKVRQENVTHLSRALGIAHWQLRNYGEAQKWFLEAQRIQKASGQVWIPTLDQEVQQISRLAAPGQ